MTSDTLTLPSATSASPLPCRISFMIGRTRVHRASCCSLGTCPALSGCVATSVVKTAYLVPAGSSTFFRNRRMLPIGLPKRAGELNRYRSAGGSSFGFASRM